MSKVGRRELPRLSSLRREEEGDTKRIRESKEQEGRKVVLHLVLSSLRASRKTKEGGVLVFWRSKRKRGKEEGVVRMYKYSYHTFIVSH
jgi:hypothetical protein